MSVPLRATFSVLRGVCQTPAYVALEAGLFRREGVAAELMVEPTAWAAPARLASGETQFAIIPWTRVAAAEAAEVPLVVVCGSGFEEAALVVRSGLALTDVRRVSVPRRGGMKDLTAMGLIGSLGWQDVELLRQPSGDGSIISLFGRGVDAAAMVEPYATLMEELGVGRVVRRTGDVWPGAPGCSLATTRALVEERPELVQAVVNAFVAGADRVRRDPDAAAAAAFRYIGVDQATIRRALGRNLPAVTAVRSAPATDRILDLMLELGYIQQRPRCWLDPTFLDRAVGSAGVARPPAPRRRASRPS